MPLISQIDQFIEAEARRHRVPIAVKFELLPVCNLNCRMCYIRTDMDTVRAEGGLLKPESWISLAKELKEEGMLYLLLTGGEVFLYPEFERLYAQLYDMGFGITINTNATLINESTVAWLNKRPPKLVSISLYGVNDETYTLLCGQSKVFSKVDHAIKLLVENNIRIELKTVLNPLNIHEAQAMADYAKQKGVFYEATPYAFPPVRKCNGSEAFRFGPEETAKQLLESNRRISGEEGYVKGLTGRLRKYVDTKPAQYDELYGFTCGASNSSCWITWQGKMTPCGMITEPHTLPLEQGVAAAWAELKEKCDKIRMSSNCVKCDKRDICIVCPAANLAETGSFEEASPFHCDMSKRTLDIVCETAKSYGVDVDALLSGKEWKL